MKKRDALRWGKTIGRIYTEKLSECSARASTYAGVMMSNHQGQCADEKYQWKTSKIIGKCFSDDIW